MVQLKPLDLVISIVAAANANRTTVLTFAALGDLLGVSQSQAFTAAKRAAKARLLHRTLPGGPSLRPMNENILEFVEHGVRYAFPAELGALTRGIPTLHGAPVVSEHILTEAPPPVWPHAEGTVRGELLEPLHRAVPRLALGNPDLHAIFALVDLMRVGGARERKVAGPLLRQMLNVPKT